MEFINSITFITIIYLFISNYFIDNLVIIKVIDRYFINNYIINNLFIISKYSKVMIIKVIFTKEIIILEIIIKEIVIKEIIINIINFNFFLYHNLYKILVFFQSVPDLNMYHLGLYKNDTVNASLDPDFSHVGVLDECSHFSLIKYLIFLLKLYFLKGLLPSVLCNLYLKFFQK